MIHIICFSPAIDYYLNLETLNIHKTNRADQTSLKAAGKGTNVSIVLSRLECSNNLFMPIGEDIKIFNDRISSKFSKLIAIDSESKTRINIKLVDQKAITEINSNNEFKSANVQSQFCKKVKKELKHEDMLIVTGSVPKLFNETILEIFRECNKKNIRIILDIDAPDLIQKAFSFKPFLVKPNLAELCRMVNKKINKEIEIVRSAKSLIEKGMQNILITNGKKSTFLISSNEIYKISAPVVETVNTVGAGDSFLAGIAGSLSKNNGLKQAVCFGAACALSAVSSTDLTDSLKIKKFLNTVKIDKWS